MATPALKLSAGTIGGSPLSVAGGGATTGGGPLSGAPSGAWARTTTGALPGLNATGERNDGAVSCGIRGRPSVANGSGRWIDAGAPGTGGTTTGGDGRST